MLYATNSAVQAFKIGSWVWEHARDRIVAHQKQPKSLDELRRAAEEPRPRYDVHNIVEKTSAEQDDLSKWQIEGWRTSGAMGGTRREDRKEIRPDAAQNSVLSSASFSLTSQP